jgi:diguanylate cyclase (GGDEF)-like protein
MIEELKETQALSGRVLIADDDPEFRRLLIRRAKRLGLNVVEAEDGAQAVEALEGKPFDVLIVDLYMPGFSGLEVIQQAQEEDPELQAIILTASATLETAIEALRAGVYDYLTKPLESLAAFDMSLSRALERRYLLRENKRLFAEVQNLAVTDALTGVYNRRKLDEALATEVERSLRYNRPLSIIMLDLDGLKMINDNLGHSVGDEALRLVAEAIRSQIRKVDLPTRFGGDEFLVLLPEVDLTVASRIADRICATIVNAQIEGGPLSVSAGVVQLSESNATPEEFIKAADQALYKAKRSGRKRIAIVTEEENL